MISVYYKYVNWDEVPAYEAAGWMHPCRQVLDYPRLHYYGTTMAWEGEGNPPMPRSDEVVA